MVCVTVPPILSLSLLTSPCMESPSLPPVSAARWKDGMDDGHGKVWGTKYFVTYRSHGNEGKGGPRE